MVQETVKAEPKAHKQLSQFKYTGGADTGVNSEKSKTIYNIVFPVGKAVEVPDDVAHKLRTKAGNPGDEFVEVTAGADKTASEIQRESERKDEAAKAPKDAKPLSKEDLADLKAKAGREDARVSKVQEDAKLGR